MSETEYKKVPIQEHDNCDIKVEDPPKYGYGVRHVQAFLFFFCLTSGYTARAHLGVTIVGMTMVPTNAPSEVMTTTEAFLEIGNETVFDTVYSTEANIVNATDIYNKTDLIVNPSSSWNVYRTYDWPKSIQEMALGSFFLGYCIMMFPIGLVCQKWGGKIPLQIAMFVNAFVSFFTPWIVVWGGWKALCFCRIVQGLSQSGVYPGIHTLLANWVPVSERGSLSSYVYTGSGFGTVVAFQLAGILAFSHFGWPSTFWVSGIQCFIAFLLITFFGAAKPSLHKSISEAERKFILGKIGEGVQTRAKMPWKAIMTSIHTWATFIAHTGNAVCFVFFFMQVPTYMFAILKLNIMKSGILSSLPYIATFLASIAFGYLSDLFTNKKIISIKSARKLSNSIASIIPSLCLALVSFTTNTALAVTIFVFSMTAHAAMHTGWMVNYMDLSPNCSGALMASGNTLTNVVVLLLPVMVSNIVTDVTNQYQWRITMFLMGALTTATNLFFLIFMSADIQPWNDEITDPENIKLEIKKEALKN